MKTKYTSQIRSAGYALILVMVMCAVSLVIMAGIMNRTSTVSLLNDRSNKYTLCCTIADAACEKVFARMAYDFQSHSLGEVTNNLNLYRTNVPCANDDPYWGNFIFSDPKTGATNSTYVDYLMDYSGPLPSQYTNLCTQTAPIYRIVSNVSLAGWPNIVGSAQEDVLLSLVPITTYAIFYNGVLEFTQTADMEVRGRVHANDLICVGTGIGGGGSTLIFDGPVTSTKTVYGPTRDGLTPSPWNENTTFNASYATNQASVTIGINMTNSHTIIEIPPANEDPGSHSGQMKLYNQAQVVILVTNVAGTPQLPTPQVTFILWNSYSGMVPGCDDNPITNTYIGTNFIFTNTTFPYKYTNFIFTNMSLDPLHCWTNEPHGIEQFLTVAVTNTFTDKREYQTNMYVTQIDVGCYSNWLGTNGFQTTKFSSTAPATILYVADQRNIGTNKLSVVRLVNGARLPPNGGRGFSVATPNPLYVKGNYNVTADGVHFAYTPNSTTNNALCTVPAALLCDAITILSSAFSDSASRTSVGNASTSNTVNAAIITGNVPSTGTSATTFSGGVHNLMRMQEDWSNDYLILNTSIIVLYPSQMATNQFRNPVDWNNPKPINPYYEPPTRQWGFDPNFYDPSKQPPGVPSALVPIRFNWTVPPPGTVTNNIGNW
jgi:hypothetical protein